jgi:hypothetical protein
MSLLTQVSIPDAVIIFLLTLGPLKAIYAVLLLDTWGGCAPKRVKQVYRSLGAVV